MAARDESSEDEYEDEDELEQDEMLQSVPVAATCRRAASQSKPTSRYWTHTQYLDVVESNLLNSEKTSILTDLLRSPSVDARVLECFKTAGQWRLHGGGQLACFDGEPLWAAVAQALRLCLGLPTWHLLGQDASGAASSGCSGGSSASSGCSGGSRRVAGAAGSTGSGSSEDAGEVGAWEVDAASSQGASSNLERCHSGAATVANVDTSSSAVIKAGDASEESRDQERGALGKEIQGQALPEQPLLQGASTEKEQVCAQRVAEQTGQGRPPSPLPLPAELPAAATQTPATAKKSCGESKSTGKAVDEQDHGMPKDACKARSEGATGGKRCLRLVGDDTPAPACDEGADSSGDLTSDNSTSARKRARTPCK